VKNKKWFILITLLIIAFAIFNFLKINVNSVEPLPKTKNEKLIRILKNMNAENSEFNQKIEESREFKEIEAREEKWSSELSKIFDKTEMETYFQLQSECEDEKSRDYFEYHRALVAENKIIRVSEDKGPRELDINQKYLKKLLKTVGEEKMKKYFSLRTQINEELLKKSAGQESLLIEF
jgi:hypothetical protein